MKIELTTEQRQRMDSIWTAMSELKKDKNFMKMMQHCSDKDFNEETIDFSNEDDYNRIVNFYDDLCDSADVFNFINPPVEEDKNCF
jgi:hypothetical protein